MTDRPENPKLPTPTATGSSSFTKPAESQQPAVADTPQTTAEQPEVAPADPKPGTPAAPTGDVPAGDSDDPRSRAIGTWQVDTAHSDVEFTIRHLMSRVRGSFTDFTATVHIPSTDFTQASVEATIQLGSLTTQNEQRDAHLRSADFFKQTEPLMTFRSTEIVQAARGRRQASADTNYTIIGDLTLNGVTREVELTSEWLGVEVDGFGTTRLGVAASTEINKRDFGVDFNVPLDGDKLLLGDRVDIDLSIQAIRG
ncbi:YceI family protein [Naumannella halotolerans]|uniref:YceI family protein n=1 Tax=Naumannella halotolerans TaxID=993414 RepID=UPI001FB8EC51|nr:YceI family protein [Naumannella halotolerans]